MPKSEENHDARLIPAWNDDSPSARSARDLGLGRAEYKKMVREVIESRDTQIRALVDSLPPEERKLVLSIVSDIRDRGGADYSLQFAHIWEIDYKRKPVTIDTFLRDEYYLGQFTEMLFPKWRTDLGIIFGPGAHYVEWLMGGAIGAGKSFTAMIALTYLVYRMSCLRDPQRYYSLAHKTGTIVFGIYSVTMTQAVDVGYDYIRSFVENSPYFQENFPHNPRLKRRIDFLNADISVRVGCVAEGTLIETPIGAVPVEMLADVSADVLTGTPEGNVVKARYNGVASTGMKKCFDLTTEHGDSLRCSHEHKVAVLENGKIVYRKARDLRVGDTLLRHVPKDQEPGPVLHEQQSEMQGLCPQSSAGELPDSSSKPSEAAGRELRYQDVPEMSHNLTGDRVWSTHREWCEVSTRRMRSVQPLECEGMGSEEPQSKIGVRSASAKLCRWCQETGAHERAILREAPRPYSRSEEVAGSSRRDECVSIWIPESQPGQAAGVSEEVAETLPREVACEDGCIPESQSRGVQTIQDDVERQAASDQEVIARFVQSRSSRVLARTLQGEVCVLSRPVGWLSNAGSRSSHFSARSDNAREHGSLLCGVQQQQVQPRSIRVASEPCPQQVRASDCHTAFGRLCATRLVSKRDAGTHRTYDVVEVDGTNAVITNGLLTSNSREFHALGQNLFALAMDEVNFMQAVSKDKKKREASNVLGQAAKIYNATITRLKSRYIRPGGYVPGMMFLISSKQDEQAFLERRKKAAADEIAAKRVYVSEYSVWEVRPKDQFTLPKFYVEIGDRMYPSRILDAKTSADAVKRARSGSDVLEVPGEYRTSFVNDIEQSLRDLAGVATFGLTPLIRNGDRIVQCITDEWAHPFTKQEISINETDNVQIDEYFQPNRVFRVERSRYIPRINPHMPRTLHIDIAFKGDSLGIACGHVAGFEQFKRFRAHDGSEYEERLPLVNIDFMLRVLPPSRGEIDLLKVQRFVQSLHDQGMPISHITTDGFQSTYLMQLFRKLGFTTTVLSVDRNDEPYMILKQAVYDRRIRYYRHDWFITELSRLERNLDERTVDHPRMFDESTPGSKDIADAVCGVQYHCTTNPDLAVGTSGIDAGVAATGLGDVRERDILTKPGPVFNPETVNRRLRALRHEV